MNFPFTPKIHTCLILVCVTTVCSGVSLADTVVAPASSTTFDEPSVGHQPFLADGLRNQYVYSNEHFLGAMPQAGWITAFAFRNDSAFGKVVNGTVDIEVRMGTTPSLAPIIQLEFAKNIGSSYQVVLPRRDLQIAAAYTPGTLHPFELIVPLSNPFYYDPKSANLLIETFIYTRGITPIVDASTSTSTRSVSGGINDTGGLLSGIAPVVELSFTQVPEPKALALIMIFGLAFFFRRKGLK